MPFPHLQQQLLRRFKKETFITRGTDRRSLAGSSRSSTTLEYAKKAAPLSPFPERSAGAGGARRLAVSRKGLAFPPPFPDRGFGSLPFSAVKPAPAGPRRSRLPPMGSSGSKNAAAGGAMRRERRARSLGARVLRPACFRRPKASGNDGNGKDVRQAKEIGCSEKSDKSQEDLHDDRCTNSKQSGLLALCDSEVRLDGDKKESNSTGLFESRTNSTNQASTLFSKHFNSCFGLYNKCTEVKLEGHSNPTSSNHAHPVAQSNSTPLSEMRSCLDQAFDSSSDVTTEHDSINVTNAASIDAPAGSIDCDENECHINTSAVGSIERKPSQRRQEPLEGTARFSRTRSVGRLRDRVLRRTSLPEARFGFLFTEESSAFSRQDSRRRLLDALANISYTDCENSNSQLVSSTHQFSGNSNSENRRNNEPETSELREIGGHGMEEHNSTFSERRRRIRSQVRALQRMGSRFENISGHDRQCILSGQHRTGNCTCGTSSRSRSVPDQTSTRASISRIVMLAEALFEVLDEIHHQAVVLASRPSVTSVGSVPAPKEVVDRMPLRTYAKSHRRQSDENAQCYICLVEYEEGEAMRVLPCLHEFHRSCVDKWLKEIHRVCPVCRYDVCLSDGTRLDGLE